MNINLKTVPNEARCAFTEEEHCLELSNCCPVSHNPQKGSLVYIRYKPDGVILEVASLRAYIDSYRGGRGSVRSMEGMIQAIAQDVATRIGKDCQVEAELLIEPEQRMRVKCYAFPKLLHRKRQENRQRYYMLKERGLCVSCGKVDAMAGRAQCAKCIGRKNEYAHRRALQG